MRILGIDPGLAKLGYGLIESQGSRLSLIEYGIISTSSKSSSPKRLGIIYEELLELIKDYGPEEVAIEELFFNKNTKTAIQIGQARGVAILACQMSGLRIYEYTPLQVKKNTVGHGRAEKHQVQEMVKTYLSLRDIPKPDDAADALAIAINQAFVGRFKEEFRMK